MGYGKYYCWIGSPVGSAIFIAAPMAGVLAVNTALYVMTIASISHVSKSVKYSTGGGSGDAGQGYGINIRGCEV